MTPSAKPAPSGPMRLRESALSDDLSFLLARANAVSLGVGGVALAEFGLKVRSYSVLALTVGELRPSQRELSEFLRLDPSQVVALVDELQTRGLVERLPDPGDRRANVVIATDEGSLLYAMAVESVRVAQRELLDDFTAAEREQLAALVRRLAFPH